MKTVLAAFSLLTIVPVMAKDIDEEILRRSIVFFPLVGAFIGAVSTAVANALLHFVPSDVSAAVYVLCLILPTGGFHIDGLSDTFDALALKGIGDPVKDRQKRLCILREGKQGPIGCLSTVVDLLLKYVLSKELIASSAFSPLFFSPVFSRFCLVWACYFGRPARKEGLGQILVGKVNGTQFLTSLLVTVGFILASGTSRPLAFLLTLFGFFVLSSFFFLRLFNYKFGGLTGDTLGSVNEFSEVLSLFLSLLLMRGPEST